MHNGNAPKQSTNSQQSANSYGNPQSPFTLSNADILSAGRIYLEDRQRKINEEQARLNMDALQFAEMARQEAVARLQAEIAAGEEAKRQLEALTRQSAPVPMNAVTSYQIPPTYEPTPSTTRIVPVEEEQKSPLTSSGKWPNTSKVPSNYPSYQYQTQQPNPPSAGQQFTFVQVGSSQAPATIPQQRPAYNSQSSASAQTQQYTQPRQPPPAQSSISQKQQYQSFSTQSQFSTQQHQRPISQQTSSSTPYQSFFNSQSTVNPPTRATISSTQPQRPASSSTTGQQYVTSRPPTAQNPTPLASVPHTVSIPSAPASLPSSKLQQT
ncbi:hypothetical protein EV361DRAFT_164574 [Lentinula raphanica]|nr:hypothetical protein EV361DRAFT_164574 [Lentinula raphanica]